VSCRPVQLPFARRTRLADGLPSRDDRALQILDKRREHQLVEFRERRHLGQRDQMVSPETAAVALDPPLS
jgi:hypothetical protein